MTLGTRCAGSGAAVYLRGNGPQRSGLAGRILEFFQRCTRYFSLAIAITQVGELILTTLVARCQRSLIPEQVIDMLNQFYAATLADCGSDLIKAKVSNCWLGRSTYWAQLV